MAGEAGDFNVASKKLNRVYVHGPTNAACRCIRFEFGPQRLQQPVQGLAVGALQQQLCMISAGAALHWCADGPEDSDITRAGGLGFIAGGL